MGWTVSASHSISISSAINQRLHPARPLHQGNRNAPKLQMHDPLHAVLRHIVVVKQRVGYARDTEEQDARCGEEEGAEIGSLCGFGDGGVDWEESCFLDHSVL